MTLPTPLQRLAPTARAELLYRAARQGDELALWRAALGRKEGEPASAPAPTANPLLDFQSLLQALHPAAPPDVALAETATTGALALGPNQAYAPMIEAAAARTGLPAAALAAVIDAEAAKSSDGAWRTDARNPRSSATGLGQFLQRTWLGEAEHAGTALHRTAIARGWLGADGRVLPAAREALLALRRDPVTAIDAVADYARGNLDRLARRGPSTGTGIGDIARSAWLAHHLGVGDAQRFLAGGLSSARAETLLAAQVGLSAATRRIAAAGDAASAHRQWLMAYLDRHLTPTKFTA